MLKPPDLVPEQCTPIEQGVPLTLFRLNCEDGTLMYPDPSPLGSFALNFRSRALLAEQKSAVISHLLNNGLAVCDQDDFAKPGHVASLVLRKRSGCPWDATANVYARAVYSEQIGPIPKEGTELSGGSTWDEGTEFSDSIGANIHGHVWPDPWEAVSDKEASAAFTVRKLEIEGNHCNFVGTIRVEASLDGGDSKTNLQQPINQAAQFSCTNWINGASAAFGWVWVRFPPSSAIGVVHRLSIRVSSVPIPPYVSPWG